MTRKMVVRKWGPALRSAPLPGAGVTRVSKNTMSENTTIFRLLKVPKYAKRTLASMCEKKSEELAKELADLKEHWMAQETEIERLRRELKKAKREVKAVKEKESGAYEEIYGLDTRLTKEEEEELEAIWESCHQGR